MPLDSVRLPAQAGQIWGLTPTGSDPCSWVCADDREHPLVGAAILEGNEEDPLVLAQMKPALGEGNLLGARAEQQRNEPLALHGLEWHEPLEQAFEVGEEAGLALLDTDQRRIAVRRDKRDPAAARRGDLALDVVRDVEHGQARQRGGDRERDLDVCHFAATSRGQRKCTSSRATVISST